MAGFDVPRKHSVSAFEGKYGPIIVVRTPTEHAKMAPVARKDSTGRYVVGRVAIRIG